MKVLAISGSLRRDSYNTALLRAAAEEAPAGLELDLYDGLREIPPYDGDDDVSPGPAPVERLRDAIRAADAVLVATPEYNGSVPGALKNALDWISRPPATNAMRNKPVAVISASTGAFGAVWAQAELRKVLQIMGARVADVELTVPHAHEKQIDELRADLRDALLARVATAQPELAAV
jgi:chromate reductase, NAD(P)H dehydrogenase (quinone)